MIDARTGQPRPCPDCGSTNVRWRGRRWHDVIRTWLRHFADYLPAAAFGIGRPKVGDSSVGAQQTFQDGWPISISNHQAEEIVRRSQYEQSREVYDIETGYVTPDLFWKCGDCRRKGHVFANPENLLGLRAELASLEDSIVRHAGGVSNEIDRDGLKRR